MSKLTGLLSALAVVGLFSGKALADSSCSVDQSAKTDCGYSGVTQTSCEARGCCWSPVDDYTTPWCFYGTPTASGYSLSGMTETSTGYAGVLNIIGEGTQAYGADIKKLNLEVVFETSDIARIKITDASEARWEVPESVVNRPHATSKPASKNYKMTYTESPFSFELVRVADGRSLFKMDSSSFIYKDQLIQLSTSIDSSATTFGLGESTRLSQALTDKTYTLWAIDQPAMSMNTNLYGSFPYYLQMVNGAAHGAMLMNSNGMDITLADTSLTFKPIGGIVDLYVFSGSTPAAVVDQYTQIVGRPMMMPYWSLGFHNCKYGYTGIDQVEEVVAGYAAAGIPLDTQWMDIDYMQNYKDFTLDSVNFPQAEVSSFVSQLHANGQHFVPIIDPGIFIQEGYTAYDEGMEKDLFIKDMQGTGYMGQVWPGPTYFPDFLHPESQDYWTTQLKTFWNMCEPDGLWIDMNEVSNFCNNDGMGQVCANTASSGCPAPGASQTDCCLECTTVDAHNILDQPPYNIQNAFGNLGTKTMSPSAVQYGNVSVYDAHNLYGLTEQIATNKALVDIRGKRPFLLTRSSFLSTGVHSAKWTGDNAATWNDLKSSIVSIMDFNLFGIPMIGADICGFIYDTTEELCARWIEVGAFYPFSRDHNALGNAPQELYLWDSVTEAAKSALGMRYQMLPYMYTLFYQANSAGATVARALWMNFPTDNTALTIDSQFMLGSAVLVSPVITQGATSVDAYFPQGLWYSFQDRSLAIDASAASVMRTLDTPLTSVNVHVAGGNIMPLQESAMTTTAGRKTPFTLLTALCPGGKAYGSLFWDDGEQVSLSEYLSVSYSAEIVDGAGSFTGVVSSNSYAGAEENIVQTITVMWTSALTAPTSATLNNNALTSAQIVFSDDKNSVSFINLNLKLTDSINLTWK